MYNTIVGLSIYGCTVVDLKIILCLQHIHKHIYRNEVINLSMTYDPQKPAANLRSLREFYNLSQKELAKDLNIAQNLVSMYEKGIRLINLEMATQIAQYFKIPLHSFLNNDFELLNNFDFEFDNIFTSDPIDILYPFVVLKDDMQDEYYKLGLDEYYKTSKKDTINIDSTILSFNHCLDLFIKSFNNKPYYETATIILRLLSIVSRAFHIDTDKYRQQNFNENLDNNQIFSTYLKYASYDEIKRKSFLKKYKTNYYQCLRKLKQHSKWSDFGDYYLALGIQNGILCDETKEYNENFGDKLLLLLNEIENQYAVQYWNLILDCVTAPDSIDNDEQINS